MLQSGVAEPGDLALEPKSEVRPARIAKSVDGKCHAAPVRQIVFGQSLLLSGELRQANNRCFRDSTLLVLAVSALEGILGGIAQLLNGCRDSSA